MMNIVDRYKLIFKEKAEKIYSFDEIVKQICLMKKALEEAHENGRYKF